MDERDNIIADFGVKENASIIKVIGVGGGGSNAVQHMYSEGIVGVDFLICNTDRGHLEKSPIASKLLLGSGLGAGSIPETAKQYAIESKDKIEEFIGKETKMLFITAGMGKGTGTGASPIVAEVAKSMGILTIGVVTVPFRFEGKHKTKIAEQGIEELAKHVDSLIVIKNENIQKHFKNLSIQQSYATADDVLKNAVKCIAELITVDYKQNVDFNDVKTIMKDSGRAMLGIAQASGEDRVEKVVEEALACPLLDTAKIENAQNFLFFISYGPDANFTIDELTELTDKFYDLQDDDAHIIWGHGIDNNLGDAIKLSIIITNFNTPINAIQEQTRSGKIITNEGNGPFISETPIGNAQIEVSKEDLPIVNNHPDDAQGQKIENGPTVITFPTKNEPIRIEPSISGVDDDDFTKIVEEPAIHRQFNNNQFSMTNRKAVMVAPTEFQSIYEDNNAINSFFSDLAD